MTRAEELLQELEKLPLWQRLTAPRGPRLVCVLLDGTLWASEMEGGKFLRTEPAELSGKPTIETISAAFRELSAKGMKKRAVTLLVNSPRLRTANRKYPSMEKEEMVETIQWEMDRTFHSKDPYAAGHTIMRHSPEGWEVHLAGLPQEELSLWEKAAEAGGKYIYEAIPVTGVPLSEDSHFTFFGRRNSGILLFRKGSLVRSRILKEEDRGKGALFMKKTLRNFGLTEAPCFFIPMADCSEEREKEWKDWLEEEIEPAKNPEEISDSHPAEELFAETFLPDEETGNTEDHFMDNPSFRETAPEGPDPYDLDAESGDHSAEEEILPEEEKREYLPKGAVWLWNLEFTDVLTPFQEMAPLLQHISSRTVTLPLSENPSAIYNVKNKYLRLSQAAFVVTFFFFLASLSVFLTARSEVKALEKEALALRPQKEEMIALRTERREEGELKNLLKQLDAEDLNWENKLLTLGEGLPPGIVLSEIGGEEGRLELKGTAASPSALNAFQSGLAGAWGGNIRVRRQVDETTKLVKFAISREKGETYGKNPE